MALRHYGSKTKIKVISPILLKSFISEGGLIARTYFDKNPLVRKLYWLRLQRLLDCCSHSPNSRVLDFGCGQGVFLPSLS